VSQNYADNFLAVIRKKYALLVPFPSSHGLEYTGGGVSSNASWTEATSSLGKGEGMSDKHDNTYAKIWVKSVPLSTS
jgi:hypothetical protein